MGTSTDALLVYGYIWEDETELLLDDDDGDLEWEAALLRKRGMTDPWESHPGGMDAHRAEIDPGTRPRSCRRRVRGEHDQHRSDQATSRSIKIADAGVTAARGYPEQPDGGQPDGGQT
jgi:hypothetical protein